MSTSPTIKSLMPTAGIRPSNFTSFDAVVQQKESTRYKVMGNSEENDLYVQSLLLAEFEEAKARKNADIASNSSKGLAFESTVATIFPYHKSECVARLKPDYINVEQLDVPQKTSNAVPQYGRSNSIAIQEVIVIDDDDDETYHEVPFVTPMNSFISDFGNSLEKKSVSSKDTVSIRGHKRRRTDSDDDALFNENYVENPDLQAVAAKLIDTRRRMELFCTALLRRCNLIVKSPNSLFNMINLLETSGIVCRQLASSMHEVRILGNKAAHNIDDLPRTEVIDSAISDYTTLRRSFSNEQKRL